ncbi:hypothetical protein GN958_ATG04685, partial [Phytophthora infestans]
DRYGSVFKTKVNKWLQTFTEYVEAGHFDNDSDSEEASQEAEFDVDFVHEDSNVDMVSAAESEELDAEKAALWKRMAQNIVLPTFDGVPSSTPSSTPSSKLASEGQQAWQDMMENSSLPDYELALVEMQEGEDTSRRAWGDDENGYEFLIDPSDEHEAQCSSNLRDEIDDPPGNLEQDPSRNDVLGNPQQMLVGRVHPRDEEVRRTQDKKRTEVSTYVMAARRPGLQELSKHERFEDCEVFSAFKALHADRRGKGGVRASDIKIPRN